MTRNIVKDEQLGQLSRKQNDLFRRVRDGTLDVPSVLSGLQGLIEGDFGQHIIDCDADPWCPNGWTVEEHKKGGQWEFNPDKVEFYLSNRQDGNKCIEGNKLRRELENKSVLNANVLDYLLSHSHLIPKSWKTDKYGNPHQIFFWGTIYRRRDCSPCVRLLKQEHCCWVNLYDWLGHYWGGRSPAAVLKS